LGYFHGDNTGSNPVGDANQLPIEIDSGAIQRLRSELGVEAFPMLRTDHLSGTSDLLQSNEAQAFGPN
jgi:hypothetical protein